MPDERVEQNATDDDRALAIRAARGDRLAFSMLVSRWHEPLFNFQLRQCRCVEDAADLTQETFLRAWRRIDRYDTRWCFSTWLFTLGRRLWIDQRRRQQRRPATTIHAELAAPTASPTDDRPSIWSVADRVLTPDQHTALWLRYAFDMPVASVARILGRSSLATRVLLLRARRSLLAVLDADTAPQQRPSASPGVAARLTEVTT